MGRAINAATSYVSVSGTTSAGVGGVGPDWSLFFWFKSPDNSGGYDYAILYAEIDNAASDYLSLRLRNTGALLMSYTPGSDSININSVSTGLDDNRWHWAFMQSVSTTDHRLYVDGVLEGRDTTSVTDTSTRDEVTLGDIVALGGAPPVGCTFSRLMNFSRALSVEKAKKIAYMPYNSPIDEPVNLWWKLGFNSAEPDFSGNNNRGTVSNMRVGDSPRFSLPFGYDAPLAVAPPAAAIMNQLQGSNVGADLFNGTLL